MGPTLLYTNIQPTQWALKDKSIWTSDDIFWSQLLHCRYSNWYFDHICIYIFCLMKLLILYISKTQKSKKFLIKRSFQVTSNHLYRNILLNSSLWQGPSSDLDLRVVTRLFSCHSHFLWYVHVSLISAVIDMNWYEC